MLYEISNTCTVSASVWKKLIHQLTVTFCDASLDWHFIDSNTLLFIKHVNVLSLEF